MSRILLTGGAGFIGAHFAHRLVECGESVDLVDSFARGKHDPFLSRILQAPAARLLEVDLLDSGCADDLEHDYTHIYHLAAILGVERVEREPMRVLVQNVDMLKHVLELARRQPKLKRLVFVSTSEVYAGTLEHFSMAVPTPEDTPLALPSFAQPRTAYMLSKLYGEALCHQSELPFTIVRPHNVYGPRMGLAHVIPQLMEKAWQAAEGGTLEVRAVDHSRTFCFVTDAAEMLQRVSTACSSQGQTLNLGASEPEIRIGELARQIAQTVGKRLEIVPQPAGPGDVVRRCPDMNRMRELTGCVAQTPLAEGLSRTWDWYRTHVFEPREGQ